MVGFMFLVYRFLEPIAEFTEILDQTQTAVAGWRRVLAVLDMPIEIAEPADGVDLPPGPPRIEVDHVTFAYRPRPGQDADAVEPALDRRDVHDRAGHARSPSSAPPARARPRWPSCSPAWPTRPSGAVRVAGIDLRDVRMASLRATLVMVPQEPFLFDTTIVENVRFGRRDARPTTRCAWPSSSSASTAGSTGWPTGSPRGSASGASTCRPASASSSRWPGPTSPTRRASCSTRPRRRSTRPPRPAWPAPSRAWPAGRTSVTIAHRLSTAARADWVLVFDHGRLVEQGHHADLLAARRRLRRAARQLARRHLGRRRQRLTRRRRRVGDVSRRRGLAERATLPDQRWAPACSA